MRACCHFFGVGSLWEHFSNVWFMKSNYLRWISHKNTDDLRHKCKKLITVYVAWENHCALATGNQGHLRHNTSYNRIGNPKQGSSWRNEYPSLSLIINDLLPFPVPAAPECFCLTTELIWDVSGRMYERGSLSDTEEGKHYEVINSAIFRYTKPCWGHTACVSFGWLRVCNVRGVTSLLLLMMRVLD